MTNDLMRLKIWLNENRITHIAMESTGVYWKPIFNILEDAFEVILVNARHVKNVPGRKTDVKDCQWILELHSYGLLNRCLVVDSDIKELRSYLRLREDHIRSSSMHINHMQKALTQMNIRLKDVIDQIHGKSGMAIIEAILKGERNRDVLVRLCYGSILKKKKELVYKSLDGRYSDAGLFALEQAHSAYNFYLRQIKQCDERINVVVNRIGRSGEGQNNIGKRKPIRHHKPEVDKLDANLLNIFDSHDATLISGITGYTWLQQLGESGRDLTRWPTEKHYTSWLGFSPGQNNSGKKTRNARKKGKPAAGQIFRTIAQSILNSKDIALGAFGRRLRARKGPGIAIKALGRKVAVLYWRVMVKGLEYTEKGIKQYEEQLVLQKLKTVMKLANELNLQVT
jgi:transposase